MHTLWAGIFNRIFCACVNSRRNFWTTNLKSSVLSDDLHFFASIFPKKVMRISHFGGDFELKIDDQLENPSRWSCTQFCKLPTN